MKYRVLIQPTAKVELREAYRWYYNQSPSAAEKWLGKFLKAVETLSQNPERCARAPGGRRVRRDHPSAPLRKKARHLPDSVHHEFDRIPRLNQRRCVK